MDTILGHCIARAVIGDEGGLDAANRSTSRTTRS